MTTAAVAMVKDEEDVVAETVGHMVGQVDFVIVADNGSNDGTRDILRRLDVVIVDDPEVAYHQSEKMTDLACQAHHLAGADWIVPFDADELWYSPFGRLGDILDDLASQWLVASAALYDHVATAEDVESSGPVERIRWRRPAPGPLAKVACRWRDDLVIDQGNHAARYDGGATIEPGLLVVRHFPYRSPEQFVRKARNGAAAYAATDLPEVIGAHWRGYGRILEEGGPEALEQVFHEFFWEEDPEAAGLVFDPALVAACASAS